MSFRLMPFAVCFLVFVAGCAGPPAVAVPLDDLLEEHAKSPAATIQKYAGRVIETEGYLESVRDAGAQAWVYLVPRKSADLTGRYLHVNFKASQQTNDALARCDIKSRVRVRVRLEARPDTALKSQGISIKPDGQ
jgi:ribosomal protein S6